MVDTNHELEGDHRHLAKGVSLHQRTVVGGSYWEVRGSQNNAERRKKIRTQEPNSESMGTSPHLDLQVRKAISITDLLLTLLECGEEKATCLQRTRRRREESADSWLQLLLIQEK